MMMMGRRAAGVGVAVAVVLMAAAGAWGQQTPPTQECASKLIPCQSYLGSPTTPPDTCCGPIRETVRDDLSCLCAIFNSPDIFKAFKINITQALQLPLRCGVSADTTVCSKALSPGGSIAPPATPGGNKDNNAGHGVAMMGMWGLISLILFWCSAAA